MGQQGDRNDKRFTHGKNLVSTIHLIGDLEKKTKMSKAVLNQNQPDEMVSYIFYFIKRHRNYNINKKSLR